MALINPPPLQGFIRPVATWFMQVYTLAFSIQESGTTAERPTKNLWVGRRFYDTTLNAPVYWGGSIWVTSGGGGGGETNTASNVGAAGVGLYNSKTGVNLDLRNINAGSSKVSVTLDAPNKEVDIDVVVANLTGIAPTQITGTAVITSDARLSDARTPTSHSHPQSDITNLITDLSAKKTDSMSTNKLLGRGSALTGAIEEITLGTNLSLSGTTLNATGGGGSVTINTAIVTVPYGTNAYTATITDASVLITSKLMVSLGVYSDTDENDPDDDLNPAFYVEAVNAGSFLLSIESRDQSTIGGVFKFNYLIG